MLLIVYLSITDYFFLWGSQRKRLIYVDAIFVSIVAPMLCSWTSWLGLFQLNRWQLHNLLFPWTNEYRFLEPRMAIFIFSTNDHSVVCYHTCFVFVGTFTKTVTNPATNFVAVTNQCLALEHFCLIYSLWVLSWSFSPTSPSGAFVKLFSVTSTSCRSDHYPISRKLCLQKATLRFSGHFACACAHTHF